MVGPYRAQNSLHDRAELHQHLSAEVVNPVETVEMENGTAEIGLRGRVQGRGCPSWPRPSNGRIVGRSLLRLREPTEQFGEEHRLVAARTAPAEACHPAVAIAVVASLLARVALAAVVAGVHGEGGELAASAELSLESVRPEGELLAVLEPVGLHAMGVRAVRGAAFGGPLADRATPGPGAVTGTVTNGR